MKDHLKNLEYNEIILKPEVAVLWPKIVWHLDEPIGDPAALSTYLICKAAKEKATVMLGGMGGEELFAGYPRHLAMKLAEYYGLLPNVLKESLIRKVVGHLPASRPGRMMTFYRNIKKFVKSASLPFEKRYLGYFSYYSEEELKRLLKNDVLSENEFKGLFNIFFEYFEKVQNCSSLNKILYIDQKTFLPCLNLSYTDKASMAASVEVRVPLLDHQLVEFSSSIQAKYKLKGLKQKYIFKKAVENILPEEIVWRKKAGFSAPVRAWVMKDLRKMILNLLSEESVERRGLLNYSEVKNILNDNFTGKEDNALKIWELLSLEIWFRTFIDGNGEFPINF